MDVCQRLAEIKAIYSSADIISKYAYVNLAGYVIYTALRYHVVHIQLLYLHACTHHGSWYRGGQLKRSQYIMIIIMILIVKYTQ